MCWKGCPADSYTIFMFVLLSQDMKTKLLLGCFLFTHILLGQVSDTLSGTVVDGSERRLPELLS